MKKILLLGLLLGLLVSCNKFNYPSWMSVETFYTKDVGFNDRARWRFEDDTITYEVSDKKYEFSMVYKTLWFFNYDTKVLESSNERFVFCQYIRGEEYTVVITPIKHKQLIHIESDAMRIDGEFEGKGFYND